MCETCEPTEFFEETLSEDVEHWKITGRYFGYPECCIEAFCGEVVDGKRKFSLSINQAKVLDHEGFVPCENHAKMILEGKTTLADLVQNRLCKHPYPTEDDE